MKKLPKPTYLPFVLQLILQVMMWLTEGRVTSNPAVDSYLAGLPLLWMWTAVGAFTAGLFLQDIFNPQSWINVFFHNLRSIFLLDGFMLVGFQSNAFALRLRIVSKRAMRNATITTTFTAIERTTTLPRGKKHHQWHNVLVGEGLYLPIASVSASTQNHAPAQMVCWGTDQELSWGGGDRDSRNQPTAIMRIDIAAHSGWRLQQETIYAICRNQGAGADFLFWKGQDEIIYVK